MTKYSAYGVGSCDGGEEFRSKENPLNSVSDGLDRHGRSSVFLNDLPAPLSRAHHRAHRNPLFRA